MWIGIHLSEPHVDGVNINTYPTELSYLSELV